MFQVVTGLGETGAALCRAGVDKLAFTGSTATGKKVMATCAETLTPVVIEAGGKDAVLVDEDADLDAAADAALWGAAQQRRPDLHRRRAGLRPRAGVRRVPVPAPRQGPRPAGRGHPGRQDRADHDAQPARRDPLAHPRRARPRRPGRCSVARTRWASATCSRPCWSTCPRTRWRCRRRPSARP